MQISPQSSSSFEGQLIAGTWKTPSEQKEPVRIQVLKDRALSNSKGFFKALYTLNMISFREEGEVLQRDRTGPLGLRKIRVEKEPCVP